MSKQRPGGNERTSRILDKLNNVELQGDDSVESIDPQEKNEMVDMIGEASDGGGQPQPVDQQSDPQQQQRTAGRGRNYSLTFENDAHELNNELPNPTAQQQGQQSNQSQQANQQPQQTNQDMPPSGEVAPGKQHDTSHLPDVNDPGRVSGRTNQQSPPQESTQSTQRADDQGERGNTQRGDHNGPQTNAKEPQNGSGVGPDQIIEETSSPNQPSHDQSKGNQDPVKDVVRTCRKFQRWAESVQDELDEQDRKIIKAKLQLDEETTVLEGLATKLGLHGDDGESSGNESIPTIDG